MRDANKIKAELEMLEHLNQLPPLPKTAPVPYAKVEDPFVRIPQEVTEYARRIGYKIKLAPDGRYPVKDYSKLLEDLGFPQHGIKPTVFRTLKPKMQ